MVCHIDASRFPPEAGEIRSEVKIDQDLMFKDLLDKYFRQRGCILSRKTPLTSWKLRKNEVNKIICAMIPAELNTGVFRANPDGPDNLPSGLTYIGQLITHDIVVDSNASEDTSAISPALNLESIFPKFQDGAWYGYWPIDSVLKKDGSLVLRYVDCDEEGSHYDFPREECPISGEAIAMIPDRRNDENTIVSQLAIILMRLYNQLIRFINTSGSVGDYSREDKYNFARNATILLFQRIVKEEFLATIITEQVYNFYFERKHAQPLFSNFKKLTATPREFSNAAFRFAHCMVRQSYHLGYKETPTQLIDLFKKNQYITKKDKLKWSLFYPPLPENADVRPLHATGTSLPSNFNSASQLSLTIAGSLSEIPNNQKYVTFCDPSVKYSFVDTSTHKLALQMAKNIEHLRSGLVNIVIEDIKASSSVPTAGEIYRSLMSVKLPWDSSVETLFEIMKFPSHDEYSQMTRFSRSTQPKWRDVLIEQKRGLFSKTKRETLGLENAPLWLFVLREASELPKTALGTTALNKIGPMGSLIVSDVLLASMQAAEVNIWRKDIDDLLGPAKQLYEIFAAKPSMYNYIEQIKKLEEENDKRHQK